MSSHLALQRMHKEYGKRVEKSCEQCCNCQLLRKGESKHICIAYGQEESWDKRSDACGLFNVPFSSLELKHRPLSELFPSAVAPTVEANEQISFF